MLNSGQEISLKFKEEMCLRFIKPQVGDNIKCKLMAGCRIMSTRADDMGTIKGLITERGV